MVPKKLISIPHHGGNWKFQGGGGWGLGVRGQGNSRGEGGLDDIIQFQGVNFKLIQKLLLTVMVDHF